MKDEFYWQVMEGQIFHVTSHRAYMGIVEQGELIPSQNDEEASFPQSRHSYSKAMGYIALFDFYTCPVEKIEVTQNSWKRIVAWHRPTIMIRFHWHLIADDLIPNNVLGESYANPEFMQNNYYVPRVEAWHPGALSMSKAKSVHEIDWRLREIKTLLR